MGRVVVLLIDGTSCKFSDQTNIRKIFDLFEDTSEVTQLYHSGIGSFSYLQKVQIISASEIIAETAFLYSRLADLDLNEKDKLIIIGYSRGAIIARMLAQCISSDDALKDMIDRSDIPVGIPKRKVDFLGLFDPVLGRPFFFPKKAYEHNAQLNPNILSYTEIIAADEGFILFPSASVTNHYSKNNHDEELKNALSPNLVKLEDGKQYKNTPIFGPRNFIAIPGTHSDVGGQTGSITLSNLSLLTMLHKLFQDFPNLMNESINASIQQYIISLKLENPPFIGRNCTIFQKIFRSTRRFAEGSPLQVHGIIDVFEGKVGVANHRIRNKRPYEVPKDLKNIARIKTDEIMRGYN